MTHRSLNQGFTVVTGHVPPGDPRSTLDWSALARTGTALIVMMGVANLAAISAALIAAGMDPSTPAATVSNAGHPGQRTARRSRRRHRESHGGRRTSGAGGDRDRFGGRLRSARPTRMNSPNLPGKASPALHLVRHGQSTWNVEGRLQGQVDLPELTALGRAQASSVAALLSRLEAQRLLTSDLVRAVQTAEIIGEAIGLVPIPTTLLREQHYGALQGLTTDAASAEWERLAGSAMDEYGDPIPFSERRLAGGESPR